MPAAPRITVTLLGLAAWQASRAIMLGRAAADAAFLAYAGIFAVFPFLLFLASLPAYLGEIARTDAAMMAALDLLPDSVADVLMPVLAEVLRNSHGALAPIGLIASLWIASSGVDGLREALMAAYGLRERRPYWQRKLESLAAVLLGGGVFVTLSVLIVLGPLLWRLLEQVLPMVAYGRATIFDLTRYGAGLVVLLGALLAMHRWLPSRRRPWSALLPGAAASALLWLASASLFGVYVAYLNDYSATYGSLGGIIATLFFFYLSALLLIWGGEFNAALRAALRPKRAGRARGGAAAASPPPPHSPGSRSGH